MATVAQASSVLDALQGRWKPVYQEVDGQMVSSAISAATAVDISGNGFTVLKDGKVSYEGSFTIAINPDPVPLDIALIYKSSTQPDFWVVRGQEFSRSKAIPSNGASIP